MVDDDAKRLVVVVVVIIINSNIPLCPYLNPLKVIIKMQERVDRPPQMKENPAL